jgi:hypothetical protein
MKERKKERKKKRKKERKEKKIKEKKRKRKEKKRKRKVKEHKKDFSVKTYKLVTPHCFSHPEAKSVRRSTHVSFIPHTHTHTPSDTYETDNRIFSLRGGEPFHLEA